jgi:hypothetical protein
VQYNAIVTVVGRHGVTLYMHLMARLGSAKHISQNWRVVEEQFDFPTWRTLGIFLVYTESV